MSLQSPDMPTNGSHLSSTGTNAIALLAVVVSILSYVQSMPTFREIERINKSIDEHHGLPGHAGVLSQVAEIRTGLAAIKTSLKDEDRRLNELRDASQRTGRLDNHSVKAEARMSETLRILGLSVPPLSDRMSTVEANLKALEFRIAAIPTTQRIPSIQNAPVQ